MIDPSLSSVATAADARNLEGSVPSSALNSTLFPAGGQAVVALSDVTTISLDEGAFHEAVSFVTCSAAQDLAAAMAEAFKLLITPFFC